MTSPRPCPTATPDYTFGAGDGNIKAQSFAFNDTHTFNPNWLNEFRVGYSYIEFFMTPIDFGLNLAEPAGIPGVNINDVTSAMSQIQFEQGGARNLGSNGNQPLITNLGNLQIFDNVTHIRGRHTFKAGGSVTFRSREILNADTIVGQFFFSQNQTSNCAGQTHRLHGQHQHRLRRRELPARDMPAARTARSSPTRPTWRPGRSGRSTSRTTSASTPS